MLYCRVCRGSSSRQLSCWCATRRSAGLLSVSLMLLPELRGSRLVHLLSVIVCCQQSHNPFSSCKCGSVHTHSSTGLSKSTLGCTPFCLQSYGSALLSCSTCLSCAQHMSDIRHIDVLLCLCSIDINALCVQQETSLAMSSLRRQAALLTRCMEAALSIMPVRQHLQLLTCLMRCVQRWSSWVLGAMLP